MHIHKPLFTIGLLTFVTPFVGLPEDLRLIILSVYGIAIMILVSTIRKEDEKEEGPSYEEVTEEVQEEMQAEEAEENEDEEDQKDE